MNNWKSVYKKRSIFQYEVAGKKLQKFTAFTIIPKVTEKFDFPKRNFKIIDSLEGHRFIG